jgi:hypothetical protein
MADNVTQQIAVLAATCRLLIAEGDLTRADLEAKIIAAQAVMEDGAEIIAIGNDGSNTQGEVRRSKESLPRRAHGFARALKIPR